MRYLFHLMIVLLFASCRKQRESYPYKSAYIYHNNSGHYVQIAVYRTNSNIDDSTFTVRSGDVMYAEYSGTDGLPVPFYRQQPDSMEVVFDSTKRIIYTRTGDNGFGKSRNMLNKADAGYAEKQLGPRVSQFDYNITTADYMNAK